MRTGVCILRYTGHLKSWINKRRPRRHKRKIVTSLPIKYVNSRAAKDHKDKKMRAIFST